MAFQHLPAKELGEIDTPMEGDVLVCADEQSAIDQTIEIVGKMDNLRGLDCGSLANAAPVEADAAQVLAFDDSRFQSKLRAADCRDIAAGAGTENDDVVIAISHFAAPVVRPRAAVRYCRPRRR